MASLWLKSGFSVMMRTCLFSFLQAFTVSKYPRLHTTRHIRRLDVEASASGLPIVFMSMHMSSLCMTPISILMQARPTFSGCLTSGILSGQSPIFSGCLTSGILLRRHSILVYHIRNSSPPTFHPDISHPEFYPTDVPPSLDISHPTHDARWERGAIQLPSSGMSGSSFYNFFFKPFQSILSFILRIFKIIQESHFQ